MFIEMFRYIRDNLSFILAFKWLYNFFAFFYYPIIVELLNFLKTLKFAVYICYQVEQRDMKNLKTP